MEQGELRRALQWFHSLEMNQVALYKTQAALAVNEIDRRMFLKAAQIEQGHVANIVGALHTRGWEPSSLASLAPASGVAAGALTGVHLKLALLADIALENRAVRDYQQLIARCDDAQLREVLWSDSLDESLHAEWFKARLKQDVDILGLPAAEE